MDRKMGRREFIKSAALGLTAAVLSPGVARGQILKEIRVGQLPVASFIGIYLADDHGFMRDYGLKLKYEPIGAGARAVAMVVAGNLDFAGGGLAASTFNAVTRGMPIKIVADKGIYLANLPASATILVRKDLHEKGVRGLKDLKGLKVAVSSKANVGHYHVADAIERAGLSEKDIDLVVMSFPDMVTALTTKAIDACEGVEPFLTRAVSLNYAVSIADFSALFPNHQYAYLLCGEEFMRQKPELAQAFIEAHIKGVRLYYELGPYSQEVVGSLEKHTALKAEVIRQIIPPWFDINGDIWVEDVAVQRDWYLRKKHINEGVDLKKLIDKKFLEAAWKRLGKKENPGIGYWEKVKKG